MPVMASHGGPGWVQPTNRAVKRAVKELVALVYAHLPTRFYSGSRAWDAPGMAMIVRMADTVQSMVALMDAELPIDGLVLLRALYEQVVIYCWVSIDPEAHQERWIENAHHWLGKLHKDALDYGQEILSPENYALANASKKLPNLPSLAGAVDEYWASRIIGFRAPRTAPGDILTLRGLYVVIYRIGSRAAHAQPDSLDPYSDFRRRPYRVNRPNKGEASIWWPLAVPLYVQALLVCEAQLGWPDAELVKAVNNKMYS